MILFVLFTLVLSSVFGSSISCQKELAGIVYNVQTPWQEYLKNISKELYNLADIWDNPLGPVTVENFSSKYNTVVAIVDAFGAVDLYTSGSLAAITSPSQRNSIYSSHDARSVLNLGAFTNEEVLVVYSFLSFSRDGQVYEITVGRPKADFNL